MARFGRAFPLRAHTGAPPGIYGNVTSVSPATAAAAAVVAVAGALAVTCGATGAPAAVAAQAPAGTVTISAAVQGPAAPVQVSAPAGALIVGETVAGPVSPASVYALAGTVGYGWAGGGQAAPVSATAPAGTVQFPATAAGTTAQVSAAGPPGVVGAGDVVAGAVAGVAVAAPPGTATYGRTVLGTAAAVTAAGPAGTAAFPATAAGAQSQVSASAPAGTVATAGVVTGPTATVAVAAPAGTTAHGWTVPGPAASTAVSAAAGAPSVASAGQLAQVTVAAAAGAIPAGASGGTATVAASATAGTVSAGDAVPGAAAAVTTAGHPGSVSAGAGASSAGVTTTAPAGFLVASCTVAGTAAAVSAAAPAGAVALPEVITGPPAAITAAAGPGAIQVTCSPATPAGIVTAWAGTIGVAVAAPAAAATVAAPAGTTPITITYTTPGTYPFTGPANCGSGYIRATGAGGGGGVDLGGTGGQGGGGGEYAADTTPLISGDSYTVTVGAAGAAGAGNSAGNPGGNSSLSGPSATTVTAHGGGGGSAGGSGSGTGGTGSTNAVAHPGGAGGVDPSYFATGGGGGGSGGPGSAGAAGGNATGDTSTGGGRGATAVTGGGPGGNGAAQGAIPATAPPSGPGGGGGGGASGGSPPAPGYAGQVTITYVVSTTTVSGPAAPVTSAAPAGKVTISANVAGPAAASDVAARPGTLGLGATITGVPAAVTAAGVPGSPLAGLFTNGPTVPVAAAAPAGSVSFGWTVPGPAASVAAAANYGAAGQGFFVIGPTARLAVTALQGGFSYPIAGPIAAATVTAPPGQPDSGIKVTGVTASATVQAYGGTVGLPAPQIVNQWAANYTQPAVFGSMPPSAQSVKVPLTPATSVGTGTGTATAGNWLFCIAGFTQVPGSAPVTIGVGDDTHSWWRPAPPSYQAGATRTAIWYTPNTAQDVQAVYMAPSGPAAGYTITVIEVAGLGPWDTVTGVYSNYAAAALSLGLALPVPPGPAFLLAAVTGDSLTAGQALQPSGWQQLATVTATNGTDTTSDTALTTAALPVTSSAVSISSVNATASDLSGFIIGVLANAPSPVPAGWNPAWPYLQFEAAFGGGFQTPPDQLQWTNITQRLWSWRETTGIQYELGELESTDADLQLDNWDGALSPGNPASPFYPYVTTGTPLRIRAAWGNRWYVISRNALKWPEQRNKSLRNFVPAKATDIWSVASRTSPTPYRTEVEADTPHAWWPCDDGTGLGGVLPTTLLNAAIGNTTPLAITLSSAGTFSHGSGSSLNDGEYNNLGAIATYNVAQAQGWMFGDPQTSPGSYQTGNAVTQQPGSAAWQHTGGNCTYSGQAGGGPTYQHNAVFGYWLAARDASYPPLSAGITVEGWFQYQYYASTDNSNSSSGGASASLQPPYPLTLWEIATDSTPVAILQLDLNGHLNFITYQGSTPTSTPVYTELDLRCQAWVHVAVVMSENTWIVYLNGGITATVPGTAAGMTSAWTWFWANADSAGAGGGTTSGQHIGNSLISHLAIYPRQLHPSRIMAHYAAAVCGNGALPCPTGVSAQIVDVDFMPDGTAQNLYDGGFTATYVPLAVLVTANIGAYTSGPSFASIQVIDNGDTFLDPPFYSWSGLAPSYTLYTAQAGAAELELATKDVQPYWAHVQVIPKVSDLYGTGSVPPSAASPFGDTVSQRIERLLQAGLITVPLRMVDPAPQLVQAALDVGGQQVGQNIVNITQSDDGFFAVDNNGCLFYWSRPHLASQAVVWQIGMNVAAGMVPFDDSIEYDTDPQRIWNDIQITPYAPDGSTLPILTPSDAVDVNASQAQYGDRPLAITSYLQNQGAMQRQADWIFAQFGVNRRRISTLKIDAASHPAAWPVVLGINVGDLVSVYDAPIGSPASSGVYRCTSIERAISYGANGASIEGSVTLTLDYNPSSYWLD